MFPKGVTYTFEPWMDSELAIYDGIPSTRTGGTLYVGGESLLQGPERDWSAPSSLLDVFFHSKFFQDCLNWEESFDTREMLRS